MLNIYALYILLSLALSANTQSTTSCSTNLRQTTTTTNIPLTTQPTVPSSDIDISYCNQNFPVKLDNTKDHISLHYDMSYDPDDYISAVADRSVLETIYGQPWIKLYTTRVIGTCGGSCSGYNKPADQLMAYTFHDVGGYKQTINAKDKAVYSNAMNYELQYFKDTILRGGRVFVKEGGESDFTKRIVEQLENWKSGSGKCVYIVQHSSVNEKNAGSGVLSYIKSKTNYIKISDGNPLYQKSNWTLNGKNFEKYGLESTFECAWKYAFSVFKLGKTYCNGKKESITKCVDFSDTHELLYILGINKSTSSGNLSLNNFVLNYMKPSTQKFLCK